MIIDPEMYVMFLNIIMVAIGGAAGALCRYGLCGLVNMIFKTELKMGTIAVNLFGCLVMGILMAAFHARAAVPDTLKLMILTGFLGAFTTFSTYTLESVNYLLDGKVHLAVANIVISTIISLPLLYVGLKIGSSIFTSHSEG